MGMSGFNIALSEGLAEYLSIKSDDIVIKQILQKERPVAMDLNSASRVRMLMERKFTKMKNKEFSNLFDKNLVI